MASRGSAGDIGVAVRVVVEAAAGWVAGDGGTFRSKMVELTGLGYESRHAR